MDQKYFGRNMPTKVLVEVAQIFVEIHPRSKSIDKVLKTPVLQHIPNEDLFKLGLKIAVQA